MLRSAESSASVEHPGKIRQAKTAAAHRSGDTEACRIDLRTGAFAEESTDNFFEAAELVSRESLIPNVNQLAVLEFVQCEVNFGAADVPGENHLAISSVPTPCASGGGRCAAAALSSKNTSRPFRGWISCEGSVSGS